MKSKRPPHDHSMSDNESPRKRRPGVRPRASQACRACAAAKVRCDDLQTCRRCQNKGVLCMRTFHIVSTSKDAEIGSPAASSSSTPSRQSLLQHRDHNSTRRGHTAKEHAQEVMLSVIEPGPSSAASHELEPASSNNVQPLTISTPLSIVLPEPSTKNQPHRNPSVGLPFDSFSQQDWQMTDAFDFILSSSYEWPDLGHFDCSLGELPPDVPSPTQAWGDAGETQSGSELNTEALTPSSLVPGQEKVSKEAAKAYDNTLGNWNPTPKDYLAHDKPSISIAPDIQKSILGCLGNLDPTVINHQLSATRRDEMVVVVAGRFSVGETLQAVPYFPSVEMLDEFLKIYLTAQRESSTSIIHLPTFDPNGCGLWLLMSCIAGGAVTSPILAAHKFGLALLEVLRWYLPTMADKDNSLTRCLSFVQSLVVISDIALWSGDKRKSEISDIVSEFAATMIRHARRLSGASYSCIAPNPDDVASQLDETWKRWIEQESTKRTVYGHFMRCTQRAIVRNTVVIISCTEISVPFPEDDLLWFAGSAAEWSLIYAELRNLEDDRRLSLRDSLSHATTARSLPTVQDSSLSRLITIYSLTSMLVEDRRRNILFHTQANGLSGPSAIGHIALLIDELRGAIDSDIQEHSSSIEAFMLEFYGLYSTSPNYLAEALLGNERFVSTRQAVCCLREWRQTRQARSAVWHSGQLFRLCRTIDPARQTDFLVFAMYQAVLCLWMYGNACETKRPANEFVIGEQVTSAPADKIKIRLDEPESLQTQRWISHNRGVPYIAKAKDIAGMSGPDVELVPVATKRVSEDSGFLLSLVGALETHFSPENTGRRFSVFFYLCRILRALEKYYS